MDPLMTQNQLIDYMKRKAKALDMDYIEMLERKAYLRYYGKWAENSVEEVMDSIANKL